MQRLTHVQRASRVDGGRVWRRGGRTTASVSWVAVLSSWFLVHVCIAPLGDARIAQGGVERRAVAVCRSVGRWSGVAMCFDKKEDSPRRPS